MTGRRKGLIGYLSRLFTPGSKPEQKPVRKIIPRDEHPISRRDISDSALKVLHRLRSQGHEAYLVGGCIRDLLLGLHPKDFDVATSASPEEIRSLFRNSRIIGRRFKLIHVVFGREVIEVATFRASHDADSDDHHRDKSHHSDSGRILRDNVYGSLEDDAIRRDFTINALYYTTEDFSIHDFCNGQRDIDQKVIRLIGDPVRRYHEDPVRMLRAVRFAAKLDFTIEESTAAPIRELGSLLSDIPSARLFDESLKLFLSGHGRKTLQFLQDYDLFATLFPSAASALKLDEKNSLLLNLALDSTDDRIRRDRPVTPAFFYAALLWPSMRAMAEDIRNQGVPPAPAMQQASMQVIANQCTHTAIPKRFTIPMREIWDLQARLERRQPKRLEELAAHPRFRAAYDFLLLREASGEDLNGAGQWWTEYQQAHPENRQTMVNRHAEANPPEKRRRRRRPRRRKLSSNQH